MAAKDVKFGRDARERILQKARNLLGAGHFGLRLHKKQPEWLAARSRVHRAPLVVVRAAAAFQTMVKK